MTKTDSFAGAAAEEMDFLKLEEYFPLLKNFAGFVYFEEDSLSENICNNILFLRKNFLIIQSHCKLRYYLELTPSFLADE